MSPAEKVVAGIDLGGTAINYTFLDERGEFLIEGLCEHPARSIEGPDICIGQIADGLEMACGRAGVDRGKLVAVGLDTPGPASGSGVLSKKGSTNFVHPAWAGYDMRAGLESRLGLPVTYLNDGNAAALWGHVAIFGSDNTATSVSAIIGTGLGGGVIVGGRVVTGRNGFGGELGHVLIPHESVSGIEGVVPACNCGRTGDLESLCSLTAIRRTLRSRGDLRRVSPLVPRRDPQGHAIPAGGAGRSPDSRDAHRRFGRGARRRSRRRADGPRATALRLAMRFVPTALVAMLAAWPAAGRAADPLHDLVVYGATSGGIVAAIQAEAMGRSVVVVEPSSHLGGLTAGGLGATDIGNKAAIAHAIGLPDQEA